MTLARYREGGVQCERKGKGRGEIENRGGEGVLESAGPPRKTRAKPVPWDNNSKRLRRRNEGASANYTMLHINPTT